MTTATALKAYLDKAHSVYHAVAGLEEILSGAGFTLLSESDAWDLKPGGKYYFTRGGSSLLAFRIPETAPTGFLFSATHADRPTFKIKENGLLTGAYSRLATEKYGGMLMSTWLDRPLSVAGRVVVQTQTGVESRLLDIDRDLALIPNVAIHMNRSANDGYAWNPATDTIPLVGLGEEETVWTALLEEAAGGKILGSDLYLYVRQNASIWGLNNQFISGAALDNLICTWCCAQGFIQANPGSAIGVFCAFDSEEVGSNSLQGANSNLLESAVSRISAGLGKEVCQLLSQSFMISADNAHALHPNHPELSDANNAPRLGGGVVLKFNANQRYATDGVSAAIFRTLCQKAGVPVQTYCNRADIPGGSTLGNISLAHVSVPTADIGLAQLAMHSCYETAGVKDLDYLIDVMSHYWEITLKTTADGSYTIG